MRKLKLISLVYFFLLLTLTTPNYAATTDISWQPYSETTLNLATQQSRSILLFVKSDNCHWCKQLEDTTFRDPAVIAMIQKSFTPLIIDIDQQPEVAASYKVVSLPTLILLNSDKRVLQQHRGFMTSSALLTLLTQGVSIAEHKDPDVTPQVTNKESTAELTHHRQISELQTKVMQSFIAEIDKYKHSANLSLSFNHIDLDQFEYAVKLAIGGNKLAREWIVLTLDNHLALLDPIWGGVYAELSHHQFNYEKNLSDQATAIRLYSQGFALIKNPSYLKAIDSVTHYLYQFLMSPDGTFYSSQAAYMTNGLQDTHYYELDDQGRRHLGMPAVKNNSSIIHNAAAASALTYDYMITNNDLALARAKQTINWLLKHHNPTINQTIPSLADSLNMGITLLNLYKATADTDYLNKAKSNADFITTHFKQTEIGSSADSINNNALLIRFLALLQSATGKNTYAAYITQGSEFLLNKKTSIESTPALLLMSDYFATNQLLHITIVGSKSNATAKELFQAALANPLFYSSVIWFDKSQGPSVNTNIQFPTLKKPAAFVCYMGTCSFPIFERKTLQEIIFNLTGNYPTASKETNELQFSEAFINPMYVENIITNHHWPMSLAFFILFGLLLSLTPCVLPLMAILSAIIAGQSTNISRTKTFALCLTYVLTVSLTYGFIGYVASSFGLYFQAYLQNKWVIGTLIAFIVFLALTVLGKHEIELPHQLQNKVLQWSNQLKGGTYIGVIAMAILGTLIVSPCATAPLLGILSYITQTGNVALGTAGLFCLGFGMGIPLLFINFLNKLLINKIEHWSAIINIGYGLMLLIFAFYLLNHLIPAKLSLILWAALVIFITLHMGLLVKMKANLFSRIWKTICITVFIYAATLLIGSVLTSSLLNPTDTVLLQETSLLSLPPFKIINSTEELNQILSDARLIKKPVLLDFYASWCSTCVSMDKHLWIDPALQSLLERFILVRVDLSDIQSKGLSIARQFNISGPPLILFFDAQGQLIDLRLTGEISVDELVDNLNHVLKMGS